MKKIIILLAVTLIIYWIIPPRVQKYSAEQLLTWYENNEAEADQKLLGQMIAVNGRIIDIGKDDKGRTTLLLGPEDSFTGVLSVMQPDPKIPLLKMGDSITVKGRCNGFLFDVVLEDATLN